jgi:hypothetical protein
MPTSLPVDTEGDITLIFQVCEDVSHFETMDTTYHFKARLIPSLPRLHRVALQVREVGGQCTIANDLGKYCNISQSGDLAVDRSTLIVVFIQDFQVFQCVDRPLSEEVLRGGVKGLGVNEVRILTQSNDQRVRGQDSLDEADRLLNAFVGGDEGDVVVAVVPDKTWRWLVLSCVVLE